MLLYDFYWPMQITYLYSLPIYYWVLKCSYKSELPGVWHVYSKYFPLFIFSTVKFLKLEAQFAYSKNPSSLGVLINARNWVTTTTVKINSMAPQIPLGPFVVNLSPDCGETTDHWSVFRPTVLPFLECQIDGNMHYVGSLLNLVALPWMGCVPPPCWALLHSVAGAACSYPVSALTLLFLVLWQLPS